MLALQAVCTVNSLLSCNCESSPSVVRNLQQISVFLRALFRFNCPRIIKRKKLSILLFLDTTNVSRNIHTIESLTPKPHITITQFPRLLYRVRVLVRQGRSVNRNEEGQRKARQKQRQKSRNKRRTDGRTDGRREGPPFSLRESTNWWGGELGRGQRRRSFS